MRGIRRGEVDIKGKADVTAPSDCGVTISARAGSPTRLRIDRKQESDNTYLYPWIRKTYGWETGSHYLLSKLI
jgi:hypothetical protein